MFFAPVWTVFLLAKQFIESGIQIIIDKEKLDSNTR